MRTTERWPSAPITASALTWVPSAKDTTTEPGPSPICSIPVHRMPTRSTPSGNRWAIRSAIRPREATRTGLPNRSAITDSRTFSAGVPSRNSPSTESIRAPSPVRSTPSSRSRPVPLGSSSTPLPVVRTSGACSYSSTSCPASASQMAQAMPPNPAPMMTTFIARTFPAKPFRRCG